MVAMACIVVPWLVDRVQEGTPWQAMAWWIHDHLPYSELHFFPRLCAFNIGWHEQLDAGKETFNNHHNTAPTKPPTRASPATARSTGD